MLALRGGFGSPAAGLRWPAGYPAAETLDLVSRAWEAHRALGWPGEVAPSWWVYQIVLGEDVVGDAGFGGPPAGVRPLGGGVDRVAGLPEEPAEVEVGYHVLPAWRGRGVATSACRTLVEQAWRVGADVVRAETAQDNEASRRVLLASGFVAEGEGEGQLGFVVRRPCYAYAGPE